jgi:broad specificity phosphatase PhoE
MKIAALYVHGRIVTGTHHGDAFSKLTEAEKHNNICSGFYDEERKKFFTDEKEFYLKKMILVRHAQADNQDDPSLTDYGRFQIQQAANFLNSFVNLSGYQGFTSPIKRCQETAEEFCNEINLSFRTNDKLKEYDGEPPVQFGTRVKTLLEELPDKSVLISHCNLIANLAQLATGIDTSNLKIHNCCILFVENGTLSQLGNCC